MYRIHFESLFDFLDLPNDVLRSKAKLKLCFSIKSRLKYDFSPAQNVSCLGQS